jgi:U32 family peptidase
MDNMKKRKPELLAPAGNIETAMIAVNLGADAIYCGGEKYSARASADNLSFAQLKEICEYAHPRGVKVYFAVNTLISETEFDSFKYFIMDAINCGIDAVIVQDLGVLDYLRHAYPDLEIHASTQMHIHNNYGLWLMKELGVKRCVVARETTKDQLIRMRHVPIELEYFIHGAICISYSGQCLFSFFTTSRSGNQGECAQLCRYSYELYQNERRIDIRDQYLISPKDLLMDNLISELDVDSLKIEGRLKRSTYVAETVIHYRGILDGKAADNQLERLSKQFSRGFTNGYYTEQLGKTLINSYRPNHIGCLIGRVIRQVNDLVEVKLCYPLNQFDAVRLIDGDQEQGFIINYLYHDGLLVNHVNKHDIAGFKVAGKVSIGTHVYITSDYQRNLELTRLGKISKKIACSFELSILKGKPLVMTVVADNHRVVISGGIIEPAQHHPTSESEIKEKVSQVGDTAFAVQSISIIMDNDVFVSMSMIKQLRRESLELLEQKFKIENNKVPIPYEAVADFQTIKPQVFVEVQNVLQYNAALEFGFEIISSNPLINEKVGLIAPVINENDSYHSNVKVASQLGDLFHQSDYQLTNYHIPVMNSLAYSFVKKMTGGVVEFSPELDDNQIALLGMQLGSHDGALQIYGRYCLMIMKNCVINTHLMDSNKNACSLCRTNQYSLKNHHGVYPVVGDLNCYCQILDAKPVNRLAKLPWYRANGIRHFIVRFYDESANDVKIILETVKESYES